MADSSKSSNENIEGFIHAVSPVKTASSSNRKYFNCTIQSKEKATRAVCFSTEKHSELKTVEKTKSPVKIQNFGRSKNDKNGDMLIHRHTKITPIDRNKIDFNYSENIFATGVVPISSIVNLAIEQLVSIKAQVARLSGVKIILTQYQGTLKKQDSLIRDTTGFIKLTLWEHNVETLELDKTYVLKNLRVKSLNNQKFLNTAKGEEFIAEETVPFDIKCVGVEDDVADFAENTICGKILGISQVTPSLSCVSCGKKVLSDVDDETLGSCQSCHLTQLTEACDLNWYIRIIVQVSTESRGEKVTLTLFHLQALQLLNLADAFLDPKKASPKEVEKAILTAKRSFKFTYDTIDLFSFYAN